MKIENSSVINQYKIISAIGKGGMGEVFLAEDTKLDRKVAIKFLNQEFSKDADKLNRFMQEAKAVSALNHPNILTVHEIGETDDANYIVTEYIEGKTLRDHLAHKDSLQLDQILKIGLQVAEALSAAHTAGIVHRDIKPENIMIRKDGYAKVLDFGLAKLSENKPDNASPEDATRVQVKTTPGMVMGTVSYMSPEQARGNPTDARTDIWSLGVVLYEMLAGKVPFTGETVNHTIVSIFEKEPLQLENVTGELQRIVRKSLTKDVDMRYQSARDLLIDLMNLRRDLDIQGELERSIVPNRDTANTSTENATQMLSGGGESKFGGQNAATQNVTTSSSSLEYAVTQAKSHKAATAFIGVLVIAVISTVGYFGFLAKGTSGQINSIAVMPFVNRNSDADTDYLSDGLAESLIFRLTQIPDLRVSPTSSVMRYKGKETDVSKIAAELGVDAVMTGRLTKRGDNLNITVELVDARTNKSLWGEQYERKLSELLTTQREIVTEIVGKLQLKLSGESEQKLAKKYTDNNEAYQLYLQGRFHFAKRTKEDILKGIEYFQQAIKLDPNFALAYARISDSYLSMPAYPYATPKEACPPAKAAAMRAVEIDPVLAEGHTFLGMALAICDWNWAEAERELKRGVELNPNSAATHFRYGQIYLTDIGRLDEAIAKVKLALELEPLELNMGGNLAWVYLLGRQNDKALEQAKKVYEMEPSYPVSRWMLGEAYLLNGMYEESIEINQQTLKSSTAPQGPLRNLGVAYARSGRRSEAKDVLQQFTDLRKTQYVISYMVAGVYAALGDKDQAFAELERAFESHDWHLQRIKVDPFMDPLRDDPRFNVLLKRVGLPE